MGCFSGGPPPVPVTRLPFAITPSGPTLGGLAPEVTGFWAGAEPTWGSGVVSNLPNMGTSINSAYGVGWRPGTFGFSLTSGSFVLAHRYSFGTQGPDRARVALALCFDNAGTPLNTGAGWLQGCGVATDNTGTIARRMYPVNNSTNASADSAFVGPNADNRVIGSQNIIAGTPGSTVFLRGNFVMGSDGTTTSSQNQNTEDPLVDPWIVAIFGTRTGDASPFSVSGTLFVLPLD